MIVKNEEKVIERCLGSIKNLVDEIVIVDTGSTDGTLEILKKIEDIHVFSFGWCEDFSMARNYSIEKTTGDYVLVLDADEYLAYGKREVLENIMNKQQIGRILIESKYLKEDNILSSKSYVSRFFPRNVRYSGAIHEQLVSNLPRVKANFKLKHDGYLNADKSKRNIPLLIAEVKKKPRDAYYLFQLGKELRISERYKEAYHFLVRSYAEAEYQFSYYGELVIELIYSGKECEASEILDIIEKNDEILKNTVDYHFAKGLFFLDYCLKNPHYIEKYLGKIEASFLSCLELNNRNNIQYVQGTSSFLAAYNLGVFYEVTGNIQKAKKYYELSSKEGYNLAAKRLNLIN